MKGGLRDPEVDLKLTIFLSCLRIMVLGCPPLLEEMPSVVAIVGVGGVQRRIRHGGGIRCSIRGLAGPRRKRTKVVIQDEPINELEEVHHHEQKILISPHTMEALAHQ